MRIIKKFGKKLKISFDKNTKKFKKNLRKIEEKMFEKMLKKY